MKAKEILHDILTELKKTESNAIGKIVDETLSSLFKKDLRASDINVSKELFELFPNNLKEKYLLNYRLSAEQFENCNSVLKGKYIQRCIRNGWGLSHHQFNWCPNELKEKLVLRTISSDERLNILQFRWCSDDLKKRYLMSKLDKFFKDRYHGHISDVTDFFQECDESMVKEIIDLIGAKKHTISDDSFRKLPDSCKQIYVEHIINNNYQLADAQFNTCYDKLKEDYVFKTTKMSELQINYLRNNFCKRS